MEDNKFETKLSKLLENIDYQIIKGSIDIDIKDIKYDSRLVEKDDLFIAKVGAMSDTHEYIQEVIKKGAKAVIIEKDVEVKQDVTVIRVKSSRQALAFISAAYFKHPSKELTTIGITGTAGKTSTTYMIKSMLEKAGNKVGLIGTICALIGDKKIDVHNTTPESYELQKMFRQMVETGCKYVVMEVSSQGLKMSRVDGFTFDYGIFTNITPEHIGPNEHENFEEYLYYKSLLFKRCKIGIINVDSNRWTDIIKDSNCEIIKYGVNSDDVDIKASDIEFIMENNFFGMKFNVSGKIEGEFKVSIPGRFSVYNSLCAITVANKLGIDKDSIKKALQSIEIPGRMELASGNDIYKLIVDYAHNDVETQNLVDTISEYHPNRLVCIFGCGGNRAKSRRYDMGEVTGKCADLIIITQDNPRWEKVEDINKDIIVGINKTGNKNYIIINDRKEAIRYAIKNAQKGDIILLIGKGHEDYLEIEGVRYPWNDTKVVRQVEEELKNN